MSETKIKDVIDNNIEKFMAEVERQENSAMGLSNWSLTMKMCSIKN